MLELLRVYFFAVVQLDAYSVKFTFDDRPAEYTSHVYPVAAAPVQ